MDKKFSKETRNYKLINSLEERSLFFGELNVYIPNLLKILWDNPKFISKIIINSSNQDIKNNLANFFTNFFYENITSSKCIESNYLYLITLLLMDEINSLKGIETPETFLNSTKCGFFLEQLCEKNEIQYFFKKIIFEVIESISNSHPNEEISFNPEKLREIISNQKEKDNKMKNEYETESEDELILEKVKAKSSNKKEEENEDNQNRKNLFINKYMGLLKEEDLQMSLTNYENKTNKNNMKDYIENISNNIKSSPDVFNTKILKENLNNNENIINLYEENYFQLSKYLDIIFDNLLESINLLPYSIRCICKIISNLIEKKFPNIKNYQTNAFISKFFIHKLFSLMFLNPEEYALINEFIISSNQKFNLLIISDIIKRFCLGKLFKDDKIDGNFTPFNWMFIEKMPKLIELYENINNVKLPNFIQKLINGELNGDYKFNYFDENKNEIIFHTSICFNIENIYLLLKNIKNNKEKLLNENINLELKKTIEKLLFEENLKKLLNLIGNKESSLNSNISYQLGNANTYVQNRNKTFNINNIKEKDLKFFLITNLKYNDDFIKIFNVKRKKQYYFIEENKKDINEDENSKNEKIINRTKNFLCAILYNNNKLNKDDFIENKISNTKDILIELKKKMKYLNILIEETIPSEWYMKSLFDYLQKLPKDLVNNDFEGLFNQLEENLTVSIKDYNLEELYIFKEKLNIVKKKKHIYNNIINILKDSKYNIYVRNIIKKLIVPVKIYYKKNDNDLKILYSNDIKPVITNKKSSAKQLICKTIEEFIYYFPDISRYAYNSKLNVLMILKEMEFSGKIKTYTKFIGENLRAEKVLNNEQELKLIMSKITDYIMEKIYYKIFPKDIDPVDNMIYLNCEKLSWIQPKHIIKKSEDYLFGQFIPDITECFANINKQKCPRKKILYVEELFKLIYNLGAFNGEELEGVDGELQIMNYALIKAKPKRITSNNEFIKLFLGNKKGKREDIHLTQISAISIQISNFSYSYLINITEEEFIENCKKNVLVLFK